jgi:hypothetical protein
MLCPACPPSRPPPKIRPRPPRSRIITATANGCASAGPEALSDYELLEMALFAAIPRRDTKPLAKALIKKFGSFAEVIHAPEARLREVDGIKDASVNQLKLIAAAAGRIAKGEIKRSIALSSWHEVIDYCRSGMAFADKEQFAVPRQEEPAHRRRGAADLHRRPRSIRAR